VKPQYRQGRHVWNKFLPKPDEGWSMWKRLCNEDFLFDYLDLFLGKGIALFTVLKLFFLGLGWMLALSIPCGVLVAALMTYGRLAQDNEIVAIKASGISPFRAIRPALLAGALVAVGLTLFNNYVLPDNFRKESRMRSTQNRDEPMAFFQFFQSINRPVMTSADNAHSNYIRIEFRNKIIHFFLSGFNEQINLVPCAF